MASLIRPFAIFLLCVLLVSATAAQFDFESAATAYNNGDFATAISIYDSALAAGVRDGGVFFNLATAYYASGDNARALLNYLRAADIAPRENDTQLQIARLRARREDGNMQESDALVLFGSLTNAWLTYDELNVLTWCVWTSFFVVWAIFFRQKHGRQRLRSVLFVNASVMAVFLLLLFSRWYVGATMPPAVVIESSVQVMNGAGDNYLPLFRVFAAAEVRILEERNDWLRVILPDGRQGWLRASNIEKVIVP